MFEGTKTYTKEEAASGEGRNQIESQCKNENSKENFNHPQKRKATTSKSEDKTQRKLNFKGK